MTNPYTEARARFTADTTDHALTVLHDDGLYRHLRFKAPSHIFYWFDLVTWPGFLSFGGDMDGYTFSRVHDMFEFFRDARYGINPGYWAEKVTDGSERTKRYSEDLFRQKVVEHFVDAVRHGTAPRGLGKAVREEILDEDVSFEDGARGALYRFEYEKFQFEDTHEWELRDWDWSYLWACHAIQWGIARYDEQQAGLIAAVGDVDSSPELAASRG